MSKRLFLVFFVGFSSLFARSNEKAEIYPGGFTLGMQSTSAVTAIEYFLTVGYINKYFLVDVGTNYQNVDIFGVEHKSIFSFLGHLGLRNRLCRNLFAIYGVSGTTEAVNTGPREWSVGAFAGLDLQIVRHFLLTGKLYLFDYIHEFNRNTRKQCFNSGSVGFLYVF